jgi:hypothetical protein
VKLQHHIGLSLVVSFTIYAVFRSTSMAVASFVSGVLVDLDHIFDYLREYGFRINANHFFRVCHQTLFRRIVLFMHAWEWLVLLAAGAVWSRGGSVLTGVFIGLGQHLIADQFTNKIDKCGYFLLFRLRNGFVARRIFPGKGLP